MCFASYVKSKVLADYDFNVVIISVVSCCLLLFCIFSFRKNVFIILILQKEGKHIYLWIKLPFHNSFLCVSRTVFYELL